MILTRNLLGANERFDLEDFNLQLSAGRADAHFYTKRLLAATPFIMQGFTIPISQVGLGSCNIIMAGGTLINASNTADDNSWWTAPENADPLPITAGLAGLQPGRNYVELQIGSQQGTPLQRAFWDPSANGGVGTEYTVEVNTVIELLVSATVNQTGFSVGDPTKVKLAIIDYTGSAVTGIQDCRELFYRAASSTNLDATFPWTRQEALTQLNLSGVVGTFGAGDIITFTGYGTATVAIGGTTLVHVYDFQGTGIPAGSVSVAAMPSGASGTLDSYYQSFTGADKDIRTQRDMFLALMSEIRQVKGTRFWWEIGGAASLPTLLDYVNALVVPVASGAFFKWSGSALTISDNKVTGMATSDTIAAIRIPGYGGDVLLTRQDGKGGSATLAIQDGSILWVKLPVAGSSRSYSENGSGDSNYQITPRALFVPTDHNYLLAYREGTKLIIPGSGELKPGEQVDVDDNESDNILEFIGSPDDNTVNPPYTTLTTPDLAHQLTTNDSLTQGISIATANINDLAAAVLSPYQEKYVPVGTITAGTPITLPLDSRNGSAIRYYKVGAGGLFVFLNGQALIYSDDITEIGISGTMSNTLSLTQNVYNYDVLEFRIVNPQSIGTAALDQPFFLNYITGQITTAIPVGALFNSSTNRLQVFRNGLHMINSLVVGDADERYTETTNNSILLAQLGVNPATEVFTMLNHIVPNPSVVHMTSLTGTILTVPTYTIGNGALQVFRNGILLSADVTAPTDLQYTETTPTSITLAMAATLTDSFSIYVSGIAPQWRQTQTGLSGMTVLFAPNIYTNGDQRLCVFRNGVLMFNSTSLGSAEDQYTQNGLGTGIDLQKVAALNDFFDIIYV